MTYESIKNYEFQQEFSFDDFTECDSGILRTLNKKNMALISERGFSKGKHFTANEKGNKRIYKTIKK